MMTSSYPISYAAVLEGHGGKDGMMTSSTESGSDENSEDEEWYEKEESDEEQDESVPVGLSIVEKKFGDYECPTLVLTEEEERRIRRPWKKGIIIKLLGRKIGFKALENRLRQMWVKRGILNIIDLGNDFFLVTLSSIEDHMFVLTGGPWLIYDHYLIVREWCPNFDPRCAAIDNAAVWVRLSGLPIEYYDAKVLKFLGNRIGTTVKVDKTTLMQERGKYARLCVEVDLQKPLLAFFEIKGRNYNIEYEGLHLLCLHCGKFGHYKEACPEKPRMEEQRTDPEIIEAESSNMGARRNETARNRETGPWVVVQKPRRQRKALLGAATRSGYDGIPSYAAGITGSRFASLGEEEIEAPITHLPTEDMMAEKELNVIPIIARNRKVAKSKPLITRNNEVAFDTSKQQEVQKEGTRDGLALDKSQVPKKVTSRALNNIGSVIPQDQLELNPSLHGQGVCALQKSVGSVIPSCLSRSSSISDTVSGKGLVSDKGMVSLDLVEKGFKGGDEKVQGSDVSLISDQHFVEKSARGRNQSCRRLSQSVLFNKSSRLLVGLNPK